jgi:8-hydroxy-5-deazaflavin:NADPH oxidoreductase
MRIGIIGAGDMGKILARRLAKLGHHVSIANSSGPESLTALAAEIGATPVSVVDAAQAGEIVILAIPTKAVAELPRGLFANVPSSVVVVDVGNYHPELRDGRIDATDRGMLDSHWVAQQIGRPVIKAFNNILATSLLGKGVPTGTKGRIALSVFGDSPDAKSAVLRLVDDLGFDPVDGGDLDESWRQQPGTPATATILTPLLSGARSPKPIEAGSLNTAPNGKLRSEGISRRRPQAAQRVNEASSMIGTVVNMSPAGRELTPQCREGYR